MDRGLGERGGGKSISINTFLYIDDGAFIFNSWEEMQLGANIIFREISIIFWTRFLNRDNETSFSIRNRNWSLCFSGKN